MDGSVRPGDDFYHYANGTWLARTPIPPGKNQWSAAAQATDAVREQVIQIVQEAVRSPQSELQSNIGTLFSSLMVADLGGVALAVEAYRAHEGSKTSRRIDGFTGEQRFFLSYAQMYRAKYQDEAIRQKTAVGTHSVEKYRVMTLRNSDAWYSAFDVRRDDGMYLPPEQRVRIW